MDPAACLGGGNPLHPVRAAFIFEFAVSSFAVDGYYRFFVAAQPGGVVADYLRLIAVPLSVSQVHPEQLAAEKRGFFAACAGPYFYEYVFFVVGVSRQKVDIQAQ